jgi:hypothetical protein
MIGRSGVTLVKVFTAIALGAAFGWFCWQRLRLPDWHAATLGTLAAFVGVCLSHPRVSVWGVFGAGFQLLATKHASDRAGAAAYRWMSGASDGTAGETPATNDPERERLGVALHTRWAELGFDRLFPEEQDFLAVIQMNARVTESGLAGYLSGDAGEHTPRAAAALDRLGSTKLGPILRRAINLLPLRWADDWNRRRSFTADIPHDTLDRLTEEYVAALEMEPGVSDLAAARLAARYQCDQVPY